MSLLFDIGRFARNYRYYAGRARLGLGQIAVPTGPNEAIVVLTGDHNRIPRALELLRARRSPLLVISGTAKGISLTQLVNQQGDSATYIHETWKKIILESESSSTIENAERSGTLLNKRRPGRIILVTSDYHMDRSLRVFRKVLPKHEVVDYSVSSTFAGKRSLDVLWKIGLEYWKNLIFTYVVAYQTHAIE